MQLIPVELGPTGPKAQDLALAAVLCGALCLLAGRLLPRFGRVLEERALILAGAGDEVRARGTLHSEAAPVPGAARETADGERDAALATGQARVEAERAAVEAELRGQVSEWASELASRIASEPLTGPPPAPDFGPGPERVLGPADGPALLRSVEPGGDPDPRPGAGPAGSGR
ncbi:hypothetical protein [Streptomyces sp. NPDC058308]|uniref:hypothetical protein n=1 Tax=Streptomyces sp. NPDC058308 TaxID=3346440 RepID=UPI0036E753BB